MKRWAILACALWLGGCAHEVLVPAPEANKIPNAPAAAQATLQGVKVIIQGQVWPGASEVTSYVTPVKVIVRNQDQHPLRIRYENFQLRGANGMILAALPPFHVARGVNVAAAPVAPYYGWSGFYIAPWYAPWYPNYGVWPTGWGWAPNWAWYNQYYGYWPAGMPGQSILKYALPEGVLQPGGSVGGFIFFQGIRTVAPRLTFQATLVTAKTGEVLGTVDIPLLVQKS